MIHGLLLFRPVFVRELRRAMLRRDVYVLRIAPALAFLVSLLFVTRTDLSWSGLNTARVLTRELKTLIGPATLLTVLTIQLLITLFVVVPALASAFPEEREKDTLSALLLTRMTCADLVWQKWAGRMVPVMSAVVTAMPLCLFGAWASGIPGAVLARVMVATFTTPALVGCIALYASARHSSTSAAKGSAAGLAWLWLILPALARIPVPGPLWMAEPLQAFRAVLNLVGESSPLSFVLNSSWARASTYGELTGRLDVAIALQAALAWIAMFGAAANLRAHDKLPIGWTKEPRNSEKRPEVGDDAILWREYVLPSRLRGFRTILTIVKPVPVLLRALVQLVSSTALVLLALIGIAASAATLAALFASLPWFAYPAFREAWSEPANVLDPFQARNQFRLYIGAVSAFVTFLVFVMGRENAKQRIVTERDKKTWPTFLTTPLDGEEIIRSKFRAGFKSCIFGFICVAILWTAGVLCLSVNPLGMLLAFANVMATAAHCVLSGIRAGLRESVVPAPKSLDLGAGAVVVVNLIVIAVAPGFDVRSWFPTRHLIATGIITAAMAVVTAVMALSARQIWRDSVAHFDAWVDRPRRGTSAENPATPLAGSPHTVGNERRGTSVA